MFALLQQDSVAYRAIAMLVATALVLSIAGIYSCASAANLTNVSNVLSNSKPSEASNHTIQFTIPAGSTGIDAAAESITVAFPAGFDLATQGVDFDDVDLVVDGGDQTIVDGGTEAANQWGVAISSQNLVITSGGGTAVATATDVIIIRVGTNATAGDDQVINPAGVQSYQFVITTPDDTGKTEVAIVDGVTVSASVDTNFDFTVSGFAAAGTDANGTTTTATSSAIEIPFGELTAGEIVTIAQRLNVTTNAIGGFVVTVEQDGNLRSSTNADIDGFIDGVYTNTPSDWNDPNADEDINDENTWGHWALTSTDDHDDGNGTFQSCAGAAQGCWVAASTTPREIFSHDDPADGVTANVGSSTVAYQVQITPLQEAADDYTAILTYIATPTF